MRIITGNNQNNIYYRDIPNPKPKSRNKKFPNVFLPPLSSISLKKALGNRRKKIVYKISLLMSIFFKKIIPKSRPWWHEVAPHLYLGAIPLKNFAHDEKIVKNLGVKAVLSLIEDFEFSTKSIASKPCRTHHWEQLGVKHLILPAVDFKALPLETLEKGVAFLDENIENGINCYVHCKAGKGRSAAMIVAYLLKKGKASSVDEAIAQLKQKRPFISIPKKRRHTLELYYQKHHPNQEQIHS